MCGSSLSNFRVPSCFLLGPAMRVTTHLAQESDALKVTWPPRGNAGFQTDLSGAKIVLHAL